jgi:hypothetical protein
VTRQIINRTTSYEQDVAWLRLRLVFIQSLGTIGMFWFYLKIMFEYKPLMKNISAHEKQPIVYYDTANVKLTPEFDARNMSLADTVLDNMVLE